MKILIVAATKQEIIPLMDALTHNKNQYTYGEHQIDVLITGVGMVATAFSLGNQLATHHYDLALNIGLAGSFNRDLELGDVVHVTNDCFSELGAEDDDQFIKFIHLKLPVPDIFDEHGELSCIHIDNKKLSALPTKKGITVNTVHGNADNILVVQHRYKADVESMEGAAFFYACLSHQLPCAQVRSISNYVEKRQKEYWDIPLAIQNLNKTTLEILQAL